MVKLRVVARIISEDDYLADLPQTSQKTPRNEKRLLVTVRDPYTWQIGTLAREIERAYKSTYQRDLPPIKYLKDVEDDCDLDLYSSVADLLLDEGKAKKDGNDQRVTIKVILEQGRAVREGSVAVGNLLADPHFHFQHQKSLRPPVPKFPDVLSSLGKRPHPREDSIPTIAKRSKQLEELQTLREESLISSIERDTHATSVDVIEATQPSSRQNGTDWQVSDHNVKAESPEYWKSWQDMPDASVDELEQLQQEPTGFIPRHRAGKQVNKPQINPELQGLDPQPVQLPSHERLQHSHAPITPPMEPSRRPSSSSRPSVSARKNPNPSPWGRSSKSARRFKNPSRRDVYDYPESEIDDSQMSPRSRMATLRQQKSSDRLSRIENQKSPELGDDAAERLSISQAMNLLDNNSGFDDSAAPEDSIYPTSSLLNGNELATRDRANDLIHEDTDQNIEPRDMRDDNHEDANDADLSDAAQDDYEKENMPVQRPVVKTPKKPLIGQHTTPRSALESDVNSTSANTASAKKRNRAKRQTPNGVNNDGKASAKVDHEGLDTPDLGETNESVRRNSGNERDTPTLDSPGEQLSQSLQESTRKLSSMHALKDKLEASGQLSSSPLANVIKSDDDDEIKSKKSEKLAKKAAKTKVNGSAASSKSSKRPRKSRNSDINAGPPSVSVEIVEQTAVPSSPVSKPLPNWGSESTTVEKPQRSVPNQTHSLTVDNNSNSRKSPSVATGLTLEEIKIMESRQNWTQEQFAENKKKQQLEAKHYAAEQKKKEANLRRESSGKQSAPKPKLTLLPATEPPPATVPSRKASAIRRSLSTDEEVGSAKTKKGLDESASVDAKSTASTKKSASAKKDEVKASAKPPIETLFKTPSKTSTKTTSVKSVPKDAAKTPGISKTDSKSLSASNQKKSAAKSEPTPNTATSPSSKTKVTKAPVTTIRGAKSLKDLRQVMKSAQEPRIPVTATTSRASSILPSHKRSALNSASDDDSDESESSSGDESEDANVRDKEAMQQQSVQKKAIGAAEKGQGSRIKTPAQGKQAKATINAKSEVKTSSSGSSEDTDEDEYERRQTQVARSRKAADAVARARSSSSRPIASSLTGIARPDPSIRDASVDPSSSNDDDEEL
ncbi:hypothetical protein LTR84_000043 [Exophiala bonariae]|uniref:Nucleolar protein Dnt1-like N-terminal domain-containing protein n=1 Tax=Exophiala bonariae TaxID=1690606 RepID=A0AAV9NPY3_9EURO|nr:hypothetical protein LTR84_000043 [Exophiala bonariae]